MVATRRTPALGMLVMGAVVWGAAPQPAAARDPLFATSDQCLACHNGLTTPTGEDVSIGSGWRGSMMANAARDPYWQAAVRREVADHPQAQAAIEDKCSTCHMPMQRYLDRAGGRTGRVLTRLPGTTGTTVETADGVSCTLCHQIADEALGTPKSFTGGFVVTSRAAKPGRARQIFGPYAVEPGLTRVMRSATRFNPTPSSHIQRSEVCATCHTLYTHTLGPDGKEIAELPEQVPYLEWRHSAYRRERSCQSCHMPTVSADTRITSVLGAPRSGFSRHVFRGGNFLMPRVLNRHRTAHGVIAQPQELEATARRTAAHLGNSSARLSLEALTLSPRELRFTVVVTNLAGHKLPTAYPSRRVWLHVTVRDAGGRLVFESGAQERTGAIRGNGHDTSPSQVEPHHAVITSPDQVQIYEAVMGDREGRPTTGLLSGVRYLKDNRLLPRGFLKATAPADVAVRGAATRDQDFAAGGDRVAFQVATGGAPAPLTIAVELRYQPIGYRWAENLRTYATPETRRFTGYFDDVAAASSTRLTATTAVAEPTATPPPPQGAAPGGTPPPPSR